MSRVWTDQEIAIALDKSLTAREIGILLGRSKQAVDNVRTKVNRGKPVGHCKVKAAYTNPWNPIGRTILAKSCTNCGLFLDGKFLLKRPSLKGRNRYSSWCAWCRSHHPKKQGKPRSEYRRRPNPVVEDASRSGQEWTEGDLRVAEDESRTIYEKAVLLKRSYSAVAQMCSSQGFKSMPERLLPEKQEGQWRIEFS